MRTGHPVALIEGSVISARRTAASAALAAGLLTADRRPDGLALIGCGLINQQVLRFVAGTLAAPPALTVFDTDPAPGRGVRRGRPDPAAGTADDAGRDRRARRWPRTGWSRSPPPPPSPTSTWPPAGPAAVVLHLSLRDLLPEGLLAARNVVDDADHACREGTSLQLAEQLTGGRDFIHATIGALAGGDVRLPAGDVPVVVSPFGLGVLDLVLAEHVRATAAQRRLGVRVDDFLPVGDATVASAGSSEGVAMTRQPQLPRGAQRRGAVLGLVDRPGPARRLACRGHRGQPRRVPGPDRRDLDRHAAAEPAPAHGRPRPRPDHLIRSHARAPVPRRSTMSIVPPAAPAAAAATQGAGTLSELIARQAALTPSAIAVSGESERLDYAGLDRRANQLGQYLAELGVGPESLVAVNLDRGVDLVVALLGVWRAGAAYLPLDPTHPAERRRWLLADSGAAVLLTRDALRDEATPVPAWSAWTPTGRGSRPARTPRRCRHRPGLAGVRHLHLRVHRRAQGSADHPRGIGNRVAWTIREHGLGPGDRVLQKTSVSFDAARLGVLRPAGQRRHRGARPGRGDRDPPPWSRRSSGTGSPSCRECRRCSVGWSTSPVGPTAPACG